MPWNYHGATSLDRSPTKRFPIRTAVANDARERGHIDTPRPKRRGFLLQPGLPHCEVLRAVHKHFDSPCAPRPAPGNRCPLVSGVFMAPLGFRDSRRHRTLVFYHAGAIADAPLVAAHRLTAIPFIPALKDGAF